MRVGQRDSAVTIRVRQQNRKRWQQRDLALKRDSLDVMFRTFFTCRFRLTTQALHWDRGRPARFKVECHLALH